MAWCTVKTPPSMPRLVLGYCFGFCGAPARGIWSAGKKWQCASCGWVRPLDTRQMGRRKRSLVPHG